MRKTNLLTLSLVVCLALLTACSNSSQDTRAIDVTAVIDEDDYMRFPVSSLDAYKIACFAMSNGEWIIATQKWSEGNVLTEQEGTEFSLGVTQALEIRLRDGEDGIWNGKPADETLDSACSRIRNLR
jgi:hypothetical protein